MTSALEQMRNMTIEVADTGDVDMVRALKPVDCTTNPSLFLKALQQGSCNEPVAGRPALAGP